MIIYPKRPQDMSPHDIAQAGAHSEAIRRALALRQERRDVRRTRNALPPDSPLRIQLTQRLRELNAAIRSEELGYGVEVRGPGRPHVERCPMCHQRMPVELRGQNSTDAVK